MRLTAVDVRNIRIVERTAFEPAWRNLLLGGNASGKTSILEGIHLLGSGRSFAPGRTEGLIRQGQDFLRVVARLQRDDGGERRVGLERPVRGMVRLRVDGETVERLGDLAELVPVLALHPGSHEILAGGPGERRRLLDWGLFHVEQHYRAQSQRFRRALAQRNQLLRLRAADRDLAAWEPELAESGEAITAARSAYVEALRPEVQRLAPRVLRANAEMDIDYRQGWPARESLHEALQSRRDRDRMYGTTTAGPHRADFGVRLGGAETRHRVSRGQQKLLVYVLRLAQAEQLRVRGNARPVILLDDVAAELDSDHCARVLVEAVATGAQLFVTALTREALPHALLEKFALFHVEQGTVSEVLQ